MAAMRIALHLAGHGEESAYFRRALCLGTGNPGMKSCCDIQGWFGFRTWRKKDYVEIIPE